MAEAPLNIVVWGINYSPEKTGIAPFNRGLCDYLHEQGHAVSMVTGFSYYPAWRKSAEDARRLFRTDTLAGVPVFRCWQYVPRRVSTAGRILHELSFGLSSFLRVLFKPRADLYIIVSPPLLLGPLVWLVTLIKHSQFAFHVQDLQPDGALALGMMKEGLFTRFLRVVARFTYARAGLVSGISPSMLEAFSRNGVPASKQYLLPNWVQIGRPDRPRATAKLDPSPVAASRANESTIRAATIVDLAPPRAADADPLREPTAIREWRRRYRIPDDAFVASYSGNLGKKQGLEVLIDVAEHLEAAPATRRPVCIVIAGDGAARPTLESRIQRSRPKALRLLPLLSDEDYGSMLAASDVCLITQARGTGTFCFPSKLLSTLVAARPVAAVTDDSSELARAVRDGAFGVLVAPDDPASVATALSALAERPAALAEFSRNGQRWVSQFEYRTVLAQYERRLFALVSPGALKSVAVNCGSVA